jgi:hypothetical protein
MYLSEQSLKKLIAKESRGLDPAGQLDVERRLRILNQVNNRGYFSNRQQREAVLDARKIKLDPFDFFTPASLDVQQLGNAVPIMLPLDKSEYQGLVNYAFKNVNLNYHGDYVLIIDTQERKFGNVTIDKGIFGQYPEEIRTAIKAVYVGSRYILVTINPNDLEYTSLFKTLQASNKDIGNSIGDQFLQYAGTIIQLKSSTQVPQGSQPTPNLPEEHTGESYMNPKFIEKIHKENIINEFRNEKKSYDFGEISKFTNKVAGQLNDHKIEKGIDRYRIYKALQDIQKDPFGNEFLMYIYVGYSSGSDQEIDKWLNMAPRGSITKLEHMIKNKGETLAHRLLEIDFLKGLKEKPEIVTRRELERERLEQQNRPKSGEVKVNQGLKIAPKIEPKKLRKEVLEEIKEQLKELKETNKELEKRINERHTEMREKAEKIKEKMGEKAEKIKERRENRKKNIIEEGEISKKNIIKEGEISKKNIIKEGEISKEHPKLLVDISPDFLETFKRMRQAKYKIEQLYRQIHLPTDSEVTKKELLDQVRKTGDFLTLPEKVIILLLHLYEAKFDDKPRDDIFEGLTEKFLLKIDENLDKYVLIDIRKLDTEIIKMRPKKQEE